ncbi:hypothetical protein QTQ03_28760 [Micromonospora sp. WMMA1363]|uniref:hypothetical protein n=1 Tax=Micromonospora sp. WMMA1363 TaxID=3053985 RepID=UPI00259D2E3A|nr:hypothetical protein [Micromonospora sp. WMMA1363]MDM4723399.1 hypothetical protein [Micromonospora sp. WMMA1363]
MMDPTGPVARRFPLIARSRPPCTALTARIRVLTALAEQAATEHDLTAAARVCNQAALIASDCAQPDLARTWCHRHARVWLKHPPADSRRARLALEPLINLARLHIRDGDGDTAVLLLDQLFQATRTRTDTVIDGITVPTAALTRAPDTHRELTNGSGASNSPTAPAPSPPQAAGTTPKPNSAATAASADACSTAAKSP